MRVHKTTIRALRPGRAGRARISGRLLMAVVVAVLSLVSYYGLREYNPITDEVQHIDLTVEQETALGLEAAPTLAQQMGGLSPDAEARARVSAVGRKLIERSIAQQSPYKYDFHLLADPRTINAFALPGGQVFITTGLFEQLQTEGQLAGVLGHEIGHVVARHGAEHMARAQLTQGLTGAAVLATYDPDNPASRNNAQIALLVGSLVNMRFGREDELESDQLGVRLMAEAGYDPRAMIAVMEILASASEGGGPPEFFSTHPNPDRRVERIQDAIAAVYPSGVPGHLEP
jgi:predicted Zn-dependent protease